MPCYFSFADFFLPSAFGFSAFGFTGSLVLPIVTAILLPTFLLFRLKHEVRQIVDVLCCLSVLDRLEFQLLRVVSYATDDDAVAVKLDPVTVLSLDVQCRTVRRLDFSNKVVATLFFLKPAKLSVAGNIVQSSADFPEEVVDGNTFL
jgi:hypothetical protein